MKNGKKSFPRVDSSREILWSEFIILDSSLAHYIIDLKLGKIDCIRKHAFVE